VAAADDDDIELPIRRHWSKNSQLRGAAILMAAGSRRHNALHAGNETPR
jgi:hypothetical protein